MARHEATKECMACGRNMPARRPYDLCTECNEPNVHRTYVHAQVGFKGCGASAVPKEDLAAHNENNTIRG